MIKYILLILISLSISANAQFIKTVKYNGKIVNSSGNRVIYNDNTEDFFIGAGQSNTGYDSLYHMHPDSLPKYGGLIDGVKIFNRYSPVNTFQWQNMIVGTNTQIADNTYHHGCGFEPTLFYNYYQTYHKKVRFLKNGYGGTSIYAHWLPNHLVWQAFYNALDTAYRKASHEGVILNLKGFIWVQGEQDAANPPNDVSYSSNLALFMNKVDTSLQGLCIKYHQPYNSNYIRYIVKIAPSFAVVEQQQINYVATDPRSKLVSWDSCEKPSIHYSTNGYLCGGWQLYKQIIINQ